MNTDEILASIKYNKENKQSNEIKDSKQIKSVKEEKEIKEDKQVSLERLKAFAAKRELEGKTPIPLESLREESQSSHPGQ